MRAAKRLLQVLIVAATVMVGGITVGLAATQTTWFKNWLRGYIVREAHQYLNGEVSIGRLGGNLFFGLELEDVAVALNGRPVIAVKDIGLRYNALEFVSKGLSVQAIRINHPVVYLKRDGDVWSIGQLIKKERQEANRQGPGRPITIDEILLSAGSIVFETPLTTSGVDIPAHIENLDAQLAFKYEPVRYSFEISRMSFRGSYPGLVVNDLSAGVSVREDELYFSKLTLQTPSSSLRLDGTVQNYLSNPSLQMQIASDGFSLPEIGQVVPSLAGMPLQPTFDLKINGPLDQLAVDLDVRSAAGNVSGQLVADFTAPDLAVRGDLSVRHLDLAPILRKPAAKSDVTAIVKPDVHAASFSDVESLRGTIEFDASRSVAASYSVDRMKAKALLKGRDVRIDGRTSAYGAAGTFKGTIRLPKSHEPSTYTLSGDLHHVNLSGLPRPIGLPTVDSNLNASYQTWGIGASSLKGDVLFADSVIAGTQLSSGSTARFSMRDVAKSPQLDYQAEATVSDLDLQRFGRAFSITALDNDRYKTNLKGHVQATGRAGSRVAMETTINGELVDSELFRGHVQQLRFDALVGDNALHVKATGSFSELNPKVVNSDIQVDGAIAASLDVDGTITNLSDGFDPDHVEGTAKLSLMPSEVGGLRLERGTIDARFQSQTLDVQTLDLTGPDLALRATGTLSLAPDGASNLDVQAESSNLSELGKLVNQPLSGIAKVDAKVTGNRTSARIEGTLTANDVGYKGAEALVLATTFTADVPNLSVRDAKVSASTEGTFVTVSGQHINELAAKTRYEQSQLDVDLTASQPQRSMSASGTVLFQPDERELRLTKLDVTLQNLTWQLGAGVEPKIRYGNGVTTVDDLQLVSGDQQVAADGAIGKNDELLTITLKNVDLRNVDAILLKSPQFTGLLNGSGTVRGALGALRAKADFEVNQGGFRGFRYESFKGSVDVAGNDMTIESELQQNAATWIRINGHVPTTAFRAAGADSASRLSASSADKGIDLHVESTPIDLGIVQGFTTVLTNVTGVAQANIQVTGTVDDPHPSGTIVITNGAFKVEPTGVSYAHLNGRIELQNDRAHIAQLDVLDNAHSWLSLTGDLPIQRSKPGDISLQFTARDFKILDNKMGNVRLNSDLNLAGELRALLLSGDLAVSTGTINLDPLLAMFGESAYSTKPTEYLPAASKRSEQSPTAENQAPGFAGIRMNVHVRVPDDLVVRSNDLQIPSSPIGLGAINVTLGGDLVAMKEPGETVRLVGTVNTVRGTYQFQGRQFTILRDGQIRFNGDPINRLDPRLDVRTQRMIQGVQANANIRGTLSRPRIQLTSVPPLDRADIFSLIVFNQPVNELGEGQQISLGQRAEQLALGSIAGELSSSLGSLLNVSEFQIQAAPDSNSVAQLTLGQQVNQNLFVKVEYSVGDVSTTNLIVEYELRKWLRLQTNLIQAAAAQQALFQAVHDSGFDLIFTFTR